MTFRVIIVFFGLTVWPWLARAVDQPLDADTTGVGRDSAAIFEQAVEPVEQAFVLLKPWNWIISGGIARDPMAIGANVEQPAAKLDMILKDISGTSLIRWLPNEVFVDVRHSPVAGTDLFPEGSTYQGMLVYPRMKAGVFLRERMFPAAHPQAANILIIEERDLPELAQQYQQRVRGLLSRSTFSYNAATLTISYDEGGRTYLERWLTVIENWGEMGAGQWGNKETLCIRAPIEEFEKLEPVFAVIQGSITANPHWLTRELQGEAARHEVSLGTRSETLGIDQQITEHRRLTNEQIHSSIFFSLADQQEFLNPYTGTTEQGSNRWRHRWMDSQGMVVYCNNSDYDPNQDPRLTGHSFRRSEAFLRTGSAVRMD